MVHFNMKNGKSKVGQSQVGNLRTTQSSFHEGLLVDTSVKRNILSAHTKVEINGTLQVF